MLESSVEMMRFHQIETNLEDQEKEGLGKLCVELFWGAEYLEAVFVEHRDLEKRKSNHWGYDYYLNNNEVSPPNLSALAILSDEVWEKEENSGQNGEDKVGEGEVPEVHSNGKDYNNDWGVCKSVSEYVLKVLHYFWGNFTERLLVFEKSQDLFSCPSKYVEVYVIGEHEKPTDDHDSNLPCWLSESEICLPLWR